MGEPSLNGFHKSDDKTAHLVLSEETRTVLHGMMFGNPMFGDYESREKAIEDIVSYVGKRLGVKMTAEEWQFEIGKTLNRMIGLKIRDPHLLKDITSRITAYGQDLEKSDAGIRR